jgi:FADH2 O2-dependent halogenase
MGLQVPSQMHPPHPASIIQVLFHRSSFSPRRLQKPHLADSFLLHDHPVFKEKFANLLDQAKLVRGKDAVGLLGGDILRAIEPFNVAGLGWAERRNWYAADAEDLLRGAPKLGSNREDITGLLDRCGSRIVKAQGGRIWAESQLGKELPSFSRCQQNLDSH